MLALDAVDSEAVFFHDQEYGGRGTYVKN